MDSPHKETLMQRFGIFFVVSLNELLKRQWSFWWSEMRLWNNIISIISIYFHINTKLTHRFQYFEMKSTAQCRIITLKTYCFHGTQFYCWWHQVCLTNLPGCYQILQIKYVMVGGVGGNHLGTTQALWSILALAKILGHFVTDVLIGWQEIGSLLPE